MSPYQLNCLRNTALSLLSLISLADAIPTIEHTSTVMMADEAVAEAHPSSWKADAPAWTVANDMGCHGSPLTDVGGPCADFSASAESVALNQAIDNLKTYYAFSDWKGIDYENIRKELASIVKDGDFKAWSETVGRLASSLPDQHVQLMLYDTGEATRFKKKYVGGGFGFACMWTDGGEAVVVHVDEASAAYKAGIRTKDVLISRNGTAIDEVAAAQRWLAWEEDGTAMNPSTAANILNRRRRMVYRAPIGETVCVPI